MFSTMTAAAAAAAAIFVATSAAFIFYIQRPIMIMYWNPTRNYFVTVLVQDVVDFHFVPTNLIRRPLAFPKRQIFGIHCWLRRRRYQRCEYELKCESEYSG